MKKNTACTILICTALVVLTTLAFHSLIQNDFVNYDDDLYVTNNPHVLSGLNPKSVTWAFTTFHTGNYHPITWLSHMLDCTIFGLTPAAHHTVSLIIHIVNAVLLFLILNKITGSLWPCAFAAALFALHPLSVESVAWAAERKNVLSTAFALLTIGAYIFYTTKPSVLRYLLIMLLFAAALLAKPMPVTLPFLLLLLDYWPHRRLVKETVLPCWKTSLKLVAEKSPLLLLSAASSLVTVIAQKQSQALADLYVVPLSLRIENAFISCVGYLAKIFYPSSLAVLYPFKWEGFPLSQFAMSLLVLSAITALAIFLSQKQRFLLTGWLWFLGTLVPVIGFVQVGLQSMADRYTYLPAIGIFIAVAFCLAHLISRFRIPTPLVCVAAAAILGALITFTTRQVKVWQNSFSLCAHALNVTDNNYIMHNNLGEYLRKQNHLEEAVKNFRSALEINPQHAKAHNNLALVFRQQRQLKQAAAEFELALQIDPEYIKAHNNYAVTLCEMKQYEQAFPHFQKVLQIEPCNNSALANFHRAALESKMIAPAVSILDKIADSQPPCTQLHRTLAQLYLAQQQLPQAVEHYNIALKYESADIDTICALAWIHLNASENQIRSPQKALKLAESACRITNDSQPRSLILLAQAHEATGRLDLAIQNAQKALQLAKKLGDTQLARQIEAHLQSLKTLKSQPVQDIHQDSPNETISTPSTNPQ